MDCALAPGHRVIFGAGSHCFELEMGGRRAIRLALTTNEQLAPAQHECGQSADVGSTEQR